MTNIPNVHDDMEGAAKSRIARLIKYENRSWRINLEDLAALASIRSGLSRFMAVQWIMFNAVFMGAVVREGCVVIPCRRRRRAHRARQC